MSGQRPLLFLVLIFLLACWRVNTAQLTDVGRVQPPPPAASNVTLFAWSSWGSWSACSASCGGGVSVQERHCLPREPGRWRRSRKRRKLTNTQRVSRTPRDIRSPSAQQCAGLDKRYHECNTNPCQGPQREHRAEQCASYDRRPFRGHFYTWVPYVDGNAPCTLNCRPRGQQFYASLGLAADGTPCTRPGFRALCVAGECKVVGRSGVLGGGAAAQEQRCGRRLVSGLFARPRLPLGYSLVATVPRGACRLNVSEIQPSENYIALKVVNGSFIMNGDFAVSAPGAYEAVGARFQYSRAASIDNVFTHGPLQQPIDIMILYTQANPSIKYEYLTDSQDESNDIPNVSQPQNQPQRHHRHGHVAETHTRALEHKTDPPKPYNGLESQSLESNVIGNRRFIWKVIAYTQCSRTCGGGLQIGKFKCVEADGKEEKEVSPGHCSGTPPPTRRRRCGASPCAARWRAAPWGPCPACGPAHKTRIVGCVQDNAKGITKISDQMCQQPMPSTTEPCDIPNCNGATLTAEPPRPDARRQVRPKDRIDHFRDGPVITLASTANGTDSVRRSDPNFSHSAAGGWLYTEWSECVGWCVGGGVQSRGARCSAPAGCAAARAPTPAQSCAPRAPCDAHEGQWFTGDWSKCSAPCGGRQIRGVLCIGGTGRRLRDAACKAQRPEQEQACGGSCAPSWYLSDWGECQGPCEAAIQTRTVWCTRAGAEGAPGAARDADCAGARPLARRSCVPARCSSRPSVRPAVVNPVPSVSDTQQRVTRHQSRNTPNVDIKERSFTDGRTVCQDKLSNCALALQARLCHYRYYAEYCCRTCRRV